MRKRIYAILVMALVGVLCVNGVCAVGSAERYAPYEVFDSSSGCVVYALSPADKAALSLLGKGIGAAAPSRAEVLDCTTVLQVSFIDAQAKRALTPEQVLAMGPEARDAVSLVVWNISAYQHGDTDHIGLEIKAWADDLQVTIHWVDVSVTYVDVSDMRPTCSEEVTLQKIVPNGTLDQNVTSSYAFPTGSTTQVSWECEADMGDWELHPSGTVGHANVTIK